MSNPNVLHKNTGDTLSATELNSIVDSVDTKYDGDEVPLPIAGTELGVVKQGDNITIDEDGTINATSGDYTLPVATDSVLGGVKQGSGVTIEEDGTLNTDGGQSAANALLSMINVNTMVFQGDSIMDGYLISIFHSIANRLYAMLLPTGIFAKYALSGEGVFYQSLNANNNPDGHFGEGDIKSWKIWMAGLNDVRYSGGTNAVMAKIQGNLNSVIGTSFLQSYTPGNSLTKTGTWTGVDMRSNGGKSNNAGRSIVAGSTLSMTTEFNEDTVIINVISADGATSVLGSFEIHVINRNTAEDRLVMTYNPNGRNDGIGNGHGTVQTLQPEGIILRGVENSTIKIITLSTTPTIIDYIGKLMPQSIGAPMVICTIPKCSAAGYAIDPANANDAIIDQANVIIKACVDFMAGYNIVLHETNYQARDAVSVTIDGIHWTEDEHLMQAKLVSALFVGGSRLVSTIGNGVLSSGTKTFTIPGLKNNSTVIVWPQVLQGSFSTTLRYIPVPSNNSLVINAVDNTGTVNVGDTSQVNYFVAP